MKIYSLLFICCLAVCLQGLSQTYDNKDSLLQLLAAAKEDTAKVKLYLVLSDQYLKDDQKEAEKYVKLAGALSKKINLRKGIYGYYDAYSNVYMRNGKFDSVLYVGMQALEVAKKNTDSVETGRIMLNIGIAYRYLEDFETAVSYIEGGRDLLIRNGVNKYDGEIYNLLQILYQSMRQYRKGLNSGLESVKIFEKSGDIQTLQFTYSNLGLNYIMLQQYDSARYFLNKADLLTPETGESLIPITVNLNYALIELKLQHLDSLKVFVTKALELSRRYDANEFIGFSQYGMAYYYLLKKDYTNCKLLADSALTLANLYNIRDVKQKIYPVLSSLYYALQDGSKGYYYFSQYESLSDSILNESVTKNTIQAEKKFDTERKETQIKLQQSQLKQKSAINYLLMGGLAALLIIFLLGYRNYRSRQMMQQMRIDELQAEKQLTATEAVLKGEEQERTRLAKDLHDGLGGMLSGIKYLLSNMKENLIMTPENSHAFERSLDMLDSSIKEMRRVAHNMMPEMLVKYDLNTALKEFCGEIDRSGVLQVSYQSIGMDKVQLDQTIAVTIYRIVQELVNNTMKHAAAKSLLVQMHASELDKLITLTVEDDGRGVDPSVLNQAQGIGWNNIKNRVEFLKGKIDINTAAGKGTSVLIELNME